MKKLLTVTLLSVSFFIASTSAVLAQSAAQSYIEKFKDNAIRIMHETGVPASIILGVAMHESASGKSSIAKNLNNQFGVKGGGGAVYYKGNKKVRSAYKKYDSVFDSFKDFARIMTERKQFSHLLDKFSASDYKGWAKGIQRSGYCSSKKWAAQVLGIINKYDLNDFDNDATPDSTKKELANNQ